MNELKNRGLKEILIAFVDGLSGYSDAIRTAYLGAEIQRCIVHQIRSSTSYRSYKYLKPFVADLKLVYKAATEEGALHELDRFEAKWVSKYPNAVRSWRNNWLETNTFFSTLQESERSSIRQTPSKISIASSEK